MRAARATEALARSRERSLRPLRGALGVLGLFVSAACLSTQAGAEDAPLPKRRFVRPASTAAAEPSENDTTTTASERPLKRGVRLRWRSPKPEAQPAEVKSVSLSERKREAQPKPSLTSRSYASRADFVEGDAFDDPFADLEKILQAQAELPAQPADESDEPLDLPGPEDVPPLEDDSTQRPGLGPLEDVLRDTFAQRGLSDYCPSPDDLKRIYEITNDITPEAGDFPEECPLDTGTFVPRHWGCTTYTWKASGLCHKPLYFEERSLERYGHSWGLLQPWMSAAHFFGSAAVLPYSMGMNPPWECKYPLGYYRPGSCAPYLLYPVPISLRGGVTMGAFTTGMVFLIP